MLISTITAPESALQIDSVPPVPPQSPRLDDLDTQLVQAIDENGRYGAPIWSILNWVAGSQKPACRAEARSLRLQGWQRLKLLLHSKLLFRIGRKCVSTVRLPAPTVRRRQPSRSGSTANNLGDEGKSISPKHLISNSSSELLAGATTPAIASETEIATSFISASEAGRALARLRRHQPRKWTGWLHGRHFWRGRPVILPGGEVAPVMWCRRGKLLLQNDADLPFRTWLLWAAWREEQVQVFKDPAAVALGKRKLGVRERPSLLKAATARANGKMPARRGRRGRPPRAPGGSAAS